MKKSSSQQSQNQHFPLRRSARLADKFFSVPDELTTKIFSKLEDDPKTLIRCSAVSKKWASFVSKTVNLTLRFSRTGESLPCSKRHHHVPLLAIPSVMKVFANLESLKIKLCRFPSPTPQPCSQNFTKMKVDWDGDDYHTYTCSAYEVGMLSTMKKTMLFHDFSKTTFSSIQGFPVTYFYWRMLDHRPKTLRTMVIMSSKMEGFRSGGKVFMRYEQLPNLRDSVSNCRVNERWLEDPQNVVHWHKNHSDKEHKLQEQVWLLYEWQFFVTNREPDMKDMIVKETDYTELLDGLDYDDDDGGDHIRRHRSI
ncbi:hypothetical protein OIU85_025611 [Salix viminalis]|uniref:F-box domain-containing protein n=1 Tax=Salix viminalis TaxID=40686 RepID=A0A9Q0TLR2_SALVM|nr:hypothetical protein OIU85_025611 [Salix viminalis]